MIVPRDADLPERAAHSWDDWTWRETVRWAEEDHIAQLERLTPNAAYAWMLGNAEWIYAHLSRFDEMDEARDYLSAAWIDQLEDYAAAAYYPPDDDWRGPVRGPVCVATTIIADAVLFWRERLDMSEWAVMVENMTRHVLEEECVAYRAWRDRALDRLVASFDTGSDTPTAPSIWVIAYDRGPAVGPSFLDLSREGDARGGADELRALAERLSDAANRFVIDTDDAA